MLQCTLTLSFSPFLNNLLFLLQVSRDTDVNTKQAPVLKQKEITVLHHVKGLFDFKSNDPDDLPFTKGE